jgi:non-ribosomal peptide synthase protein (TIGR01720 family)
MSNGSLIKFAHIDLGPGSQSYLSIIIHPLLSDSYSWGIILDHLELAYQQLSEDGDIQLPDKTVSFKNWNHRLTAFANSESLQKELSFWSMRQDMEVVPLPEDNPKDREENGGRPTSSVKLDLSIEDTNSLLTEVPIAYKTLITDVLITSLVVTFHKWTGNPYLMVDILGHGREVLFDDIDLSQTAGCFSVIYPALLESADMSGIGEILVAIKEQLRSIPNDGIGYGLLRYLGKDDGLREKLETRPQAQLCFQYLGQFDNLLSSSEIFRSKNIIYNPLRIPAEVNQYLIEISAITIADQLHLNWTYSKAAYQQKSIEQLAKEFMETLKEIIDHCRAVEVGRYTPSDFPEANLTQQELDALLEEIIDYED